MPGTELQWHEALRLRLEVRLERLWLIFEPTIWRSETKPTGDESEDALKNEREGRIAAVFISERLKTRYNQLAYNLIDAWLSILFGDQEHTTINALGIADGVDASFTIARLTAFSRRRSMTYLEAPSLPGYSVLPEPRLLYHPGRQEDNSVHPLDGLLRFGPYGRSLLHSVLDPIVVAIVAPHNEASQSSCSSASSIAFTSHANVKAICVLFPVSLGCSE